MPLADPVEMVIDFLAARVAPTVVPKVPATRPDVFVTVQRSGGVTINRVLDEPLLTIQGWGTSVATASDLAHECREFLLNEYTAMPLVRAVEVVSLYWDPDPDSKQDRYTLSVRLRVRARRLDQS